MLQICDSTGHWTAVCDYYWSCNNAIVACRQLGYNDLSKNIENIYRILHYFLGPKYSYNGEPWTKIGFGPYRCSSNSYSSLFSCSDDSSYYRYSTYYCDPSRDTITLKCSSSQGN